MTNPANVINEITKATKSLSNIGGVIHFAPIDFYFDPKTAKEEIDTSIKSLFLIIKRINNQLDQANCIISSVSFNSVVFPYLANISEHANSIPNLVYNINPVFAGMTGMFKTLHKEMPQCLIKMTDFSHDYFLHNIKDIINTYVSELMSGDSRVETGYKDGRRYALKLEEQKLESESIKHDTFIRKGSTILITGGARGITFEIAKELVRQFNVNLVIIGRTNTNMENIAGLNESNLTNFDELLGFIKEKMKGAKPLEIKKAAENILKIREIKSNLDELKSLGSEVYYEALDVYDYNAVKIVADNYPDIDGIIHGAGVEESIFIEKKDMDSFNRVFDSKVYGALN